MSGPSSDSGNFGGGGDTSSFDCVRVSIKTNIISPDPDVLSEISVGAILSIRLLTATGPLVAVTDTSKDLGSVFTKDPALLIECITNGFNYKATVLSISDGDVQILIANR